MESRIRRNKLGNDHRITWREDDTEYSRRIREWWKTRVGKFPYHSLTLRLVVLTQTSSCSVERVFSHLSLIREISGENLKEDITFFVFCCNLMVILVNFLNSTIMVGILILEIIMIY